MLMDTWVADNLGTAIDYDKVYGIQCVDLVKDYIENVVEIQPLSIGNAIEYYNKRYKLSYLKDNFKWIDNTPSFIPQKGDIGVFKTNSKCGHIVVCTGEGTTHTFQAYDENHMGKHTPMLEHTFYYNDGNGRILLGVHRPYNQTNITPAKGSWMHDKIGWYYMNSDGTCLKKTWKQDSTDWCYLDAEGYMMTNGWVMDSQGWCFVKDDGHLLRDGYAYDNQGKHYLNKEGHMEW